ncbi:hypothetical protein V6N11_018473 [Hibiscus sabdariffa]|uniref:Uncharacterized protein n=1 Tax=Hibiscus sabdariffa TaxID=183260 RepID=A0ABR2T811_9ROSI
MFHSHLLNISFPFSKPLAAEYHRRRLPSPVPTNHDCHHEALNTLSLFLRSRFRRGHPISTGMAPKLSAPPPTPPSVEFPDQTMTPKGPPRVSMAVMGCHRVRQRRVKGVCWCWHSACKGRGSRVAS